MDTQYTNEIDRFIDGLTDVERDRLIMGQTWASMHDHSRPDLFEQVWRAGLRTADTPPCCLVDVARGKAEAWLTDVKASIAYEGACRVHGRDTVVRYIKERAARGNRPSLLGPEQPTQIEEIA